MVSLKALKAHFRLPAQSALNAGTARHITGLFRRGQVMSPRQSFCDAGNAGTPGANMIEGSVFRVKVRPDSSCNEIVCFDREKNVYRVNIKAPAENNKANRELIRFLSKKLKRSVKISSGLNGRTKVVKAL